MNTACSTVLIVLRLTPIRSASWACVQPLASRAWRTRFASSAKRALLQRSEAHQGSAETDAEYHVDRDRCPNRLEAIDSVEDHRGDHRQDESERECAMTVFTRDLVFHQ